MTARDARGFTMSVRFTGANSDSDEVVEFASASPCVRHPEDERAQSESSLSRADVSWILVENVNMADGRPVGSADPSEKPQRSGCVVATDPPWRYTVRRTYVEPGENLVARWRKGFDKLLGQGFVADNGPDTAGPYDVSMVDRRGFRVTISFVAPTANSPRRVDISSTSPCLRHPDPLDDLPS